MPSKHLLLVSSTLKKTHCVFPKHVRFLASSVSTPAEKTSTWERGAKMVKNVDRENNPYLDAIRETHDPSMHIKTIEDELKSTIGKALGKQGEKIMMYLRAMEQEKRHHASLLEKHDAMERVVIESAEKHNEYRKHCMTARWELMVHRQAAGFLVDNHRFVMERYPIPEPIPTEPVEEGAESQNKVATPKKEQKITGQLDWWQRVGRWR
eukprot:Nitzschia sp. Nitz4//scaffold110_size71422//64604//65230//NITZ4_005885-RA/size71422-processed-gene-0.76-mRNA-1//-1//CDS//3329533122//4511//frame0